MPKLVKKTLIWILCLLIAYTILFYSLRWFVGGKSLFKVVFYPLIYVSAYRDDSPYHGKDVEGYVIKLSGMYTFYEASEVEKMLSDETLFPNNMDYRKGFMYEWVPFVKNEPLVKKLNYIKLEESHYEYSQERVMVSYQRVLFEEKGRFIFINVPLNMRLIEN